MARIPGDLTLERTLDDCPFLRDEIEINVIDPFVVGNGHFSGCEHIAATAEHQGGCIRNSHLSPVIRNIIDSCLQIGSCLFTIYVERHPVIAIFDTEIHQDVAFSVIPDFGKLEFRRLFNCFLLEKHFLKMVDGEVSLRPVAFRYHHRLGQSRERQCEKA